MWASSDVLWGTRIQYSVLPFSPSQQCRKCTGKSKPRYRRKPVFQSWMGNKTRRFLLPALRRGIACILVVIRVRFCSNMLLNTQMCPVVSQMMRRLQDALRATTWRPTCSSVIAISLPLVFQGIHTLLKLSLWRNLG